MEERERTRLAWPGLNWSEVGEEDEVVGWAHGLVGLLDVLGQWVLGALTLEVRLNYKVAPWIFGCDRISRS